jgi:ferritin-like metal-binding protein YciE
MAIFSKPIKSLEDLFTHTLQDIYYAENQIVKNLPTMVEKASDPQLKQGFQTHLQETQNQIKRLEQVFQALGQQAKGVTCQAIDGILAEAKEVMGGTLIALAKQLGKTQCVSPLEQTLQEEKATDKKLTDIAESRVNRKAA